MKITLLLLFLQTLCIAATGFNAPILYPQEIEGLRMYDRLDRFLNITRTSEQRKVRNTISIGIDGILFKKINLGKQPQKKFVIDVEDKKKNHISFQLDSNGSVSNISVKGALLTKQKQLIISILQYINFGPMPHPKISVYVPVEESGYIQNKKREVRRLYWAAIDEFNRKHFRSRYKRKNESHSCDQCKHLKRDRVGRKRLRSFIKVISVQGAQDSKEVKSVIKNQSKKFQHTCNRYFKKEYQVRYKSVLSLTIDSLGNITDATFNTNIRY